MPTTPQAQFNFKNENVQASTPLLGVSHVLACTTRGKFNSPDTLISSWAQFQRVYGNEIVPDGTISNIKKALELGSVLRVSRVAGDPDVVEYGYAKYNSSEANIVISLIDPSDGNTKYKATMKLRTAEQGSPVVDNVGFNLDRTFYLRLQVNPGPTTKINLIQSSSKNFEAANILASNLMFSAAKYDMSMPADSDGNSNKVAFIEPEVLVNFLNNAPYVTLELVSVTDGDGEVDPNFNTGGMDGVISLLRSFSNWFATFSVNTSVLQSGSVDLTINEGNNGGDSTAQSWKDAYDAIKGYNDAYQLACSHIHQHLPSDYTQVLSHIAKEVTSNFDQVLYVEVPKYTADNSIASPEDILDWLEGMIPIIGYSKNVAYFGGGIKYYNENGSLQNCDVLGTVLGLGDTAASNNGPWCSFSGMNRGTVPAAVGPVTINLGASGYINTLQELANWYMNIFLIKDTRTQGKQTMLWHNFTSNPTNNSEKFLSIVRLNLYLKKNLMPILESYLDEPNTWDTWKNIYYEAKEVLDDLVTRNAMSEYDWQGDQFATSYKDLTVNNEADVRQGKYKISLKYKDIVPMQEVSIDITIDSASKDISLTVTE